MEEEVLAFWEEKEIFKKSLKKDSPKGEFVFYDGPPFATGLPHYGHLLASTIKDVIPRYKTMRGYHVRRVWGWDCHGLPIENIVEGQLEISGKREIDAKGVDVFNETCRSCVLKYAEEWGKTVKRIGRWVDFENSYKTMDSTYMESVWWAVKQIWEKGLLYEGRKVLLYCPRCETPISNFEVAMDNSYQDVTEESVSVKFRVMDPALHGLPENTFFIAWTTTPWTLPGNVALAVGADIEYVLVKHGEEHLVVAKDRRAIVEGEEVRMIKGSELADICYEPLYDLPSVRESGKDSYYVTTADFVTTEEGTGIVHTAVVYGEDDYALGLKRDLPVVPLLDAQGRFNDEAPEFLRGVYFKDADRLVKKDLESRGLLFKREQTTHSYPHCWRCSTPLFYNAIPAWFINIQKIKNRLLERSESIRWYPEHLKDGRFKKGLEGAPDWNISRNRYWATAIPIWKCEDEDCRGIECIGSVAELREKATNFDKVYGGKTNLAKLDLHKPYIDEVELACGTCGRTMRRIPEVIDCWVESASMSFAELHAPFENKELFEKRYPAQFVAEYIAQTRAWFYVMHVMGTILFDRAPFENVVTTGTILNERGEKLSKSKKNYTDPSVILEVHGADALRFYLMTSVVMKGENLFFVDREVEDVVKKVLNLVSNCASFYKQHDGRIELLDAPDTTHILDRWIAALLHETVEAITREMDVYDTVRSGRLLRDFIGDLSQWYLRRSRGRFKGNDKEARAAITMLRHVLLELAKLMAPFTPFIAESIYRDLSGEKESVHLEEWPSCHSVPAEESSSVVKTSRQVRGDILQDMQQAREIVTMALEKRASAKIPVRQALASLTVSMMGTLSDELKAIIADEVNVKEVVCHPEPAEGSLLFVELDTTLTPELIEEGMAREIIRRVNDLRKESGLTIGDSIKLFIGTDSDQVKTTLQNHRETILQGTHASEIMELNDQESKEYTISDDLVRMTIEVDRLMS